MQQQPSADSYTVDSGDTDQLLKQAVTKVSAQYLYPYQMHGALASSCAVCDVQGGSGDSATAKIWSATQGVYPQRDSVAMVLGIPKANVRVIFVEGSGCYGLNGNDSVTGVKATGQVISFPDPQTLTPFRDLRRRMA
jgi:CO/xanthine dehydrogenase Mo-binding subunit